jgi:hypothetical protein
MVPKLGEATGPAGPRFFTHPMTAEPPFQQMPALDATFSNGHASPEKWLQGGVLIRPAEAITFPTFSCDLTVVI